MRFLDFTLLTLLSIRLMSLSWEALRRSSFLTTKENSFNFTPCCPVRYSFSFSFSFRTDINFSSSTDVLGWLSLNSSTRPFSLSRDSRPPLKTSSSKTSDPSARASARRMTVNRFCSLMSGSERSCSWWVRRRGWRGTCMQLCRLCSARVPVRPYRGQNSLQTLLLRRARKSVSLCLANSPAEHFLPRSTREQRCC